MVDLDSVWVADLAELKAVSTFHLWTIFVLRLVLTGDYRSDGFPWYGYGRRAGTVQPSTATESKSEQYRPSERLRTDEGWDVCAE